MMEDIEKVTSANYIKLAMRTDLQDYTPVVRRLLNYARIEMPDGFDPNILRARHAVDGLVTEVGEVADHLKKFCQYGRDLKEEDLKGELGDIFWYLALFLDAFDLELDDVLEHNIRKLQARYPHKFTEEQALNRLSG